MSLLDKDLTELESVGSAFDQKTGMTYPMYADGTHDEEMGCHIDDIENEEWFDALSETDLYSIKDYYQKGKK